MTKPNQVSESFDLLDLKPTGIAEITKKLKINRTDLFTLWFIRQKGIVRTDDHRGRFAVQAHEVAEELLRWEICNQNQSYQSARRLLNQGLICIYHFTQNIRKQIFGEKQYSSRHWRVFYPTEKGLEIISRIEQEVERLAV